MSSAICIGVACCLSLKQPSVTSCCSVQIDSDVAEGGIFSIQVLK